MNLNIFYGILIPFLGTSIGAACVFFMKNTLSDKIQRALTGFAAGVMVAASVWSLIIPAIEQSASMGKLSFLPAAIGFWIGILFLLLLDHIIPHLILFCAASCHIKDSLFICNRTAAKFLNYQHNFLLQFLHFYTSSSTLIICRISG